MTDIRIAPKLDILFKPKRFKVMFGGRGSAKSQSVALAVLIKCMGSVTRVLCTRQLQTSIKESVIKLLTDLIYENKLESFFTITNQSIKGANGSDIIFEGLHNNVSKIKSMQGVDIVWCEESDAITDDSWKVLIPTIRKDGSEIWVVFNPMDEMDDTYQRFVAPFFDKMSENGVYEDDLHYVTRMNYVDNPWFPEELRLDMERMKIHDYKQYLHVYSGECISDYKDSIIDPLWVRASIDAHVKLGFKPKGVLSLGYDPADGGKDSKAYIIRHGTVVIDGCQWHDGDISDSIDKVFEVARDKQVTDIVYDVIGIGAAVKDYVRRLEGRDRFTVTGFNAATAPDNPEKKYMGDRYNDEVFKNRRAQAFWYVRDRFEKTYRAVEKGEYMDPEDMISISSDLPDLKVLMSELSRIQRKRGNNTSIQIESKDDMKKRGMASPGMADSLVYAFSNPSVNFRNDNWDVPINQ